MKCRPVRHHFLSSSLSVVTLCLVGSMYNDGDGEAMTLGEVIKLVGQWRDQRHYRLQWQGKSGNDSCSTQEGDDGGNKNENDDDDERRRPGLWFSIQSKRCHAEIFKIIGKCSSAWWRRSETFTSEHLAIASGQNLDSNLFQKSKKNQRELWRDRVICTRQVNCRSGRVKENKNFNKFQPKNFISLSTHRPLRFIFQHTHLHPCHQCWPQHKNEQRENSV